MVLMNDMNSELAREKMWSRIHLIPVLQAEEDRDLVRRHYADKAREKELLGSETSAYHSDRYVFGHSTFVKLILMLWYLDSFDRRSRLHQKRYQNEEHWFVRLVHIGH
jgi:hypothetical protein